MWNDDGLGCKDRAIVQKYFLKAIVLSPDVEPYFSAYFIAVCEEKGLAYAMRPELDEFSGRLFLC